jgi:hypothetical protein
LPVFFCGVTFPTTPAIVGKGWNLYGARVVEPVEEVERRIGELRATVRRSILAGDRVRANAVRAELRQAERAWDEAIAGIDAPPARRRRGGTLLPIREQVHHALTLLSVPAAPKLLIEVHVAFLGSEEIANGRLTHLRRDEERSFRSAPYARPYYLCSTLTAEHLAPVRGLLAVSTWPLERRIIGPLSPRVDFLSAAVRVAEQAARQPGTAADLSPAIARLLRRFAVSIPGAPRNAAVTEPEEVAAAARVELAVHAEADRAQREAGAVRAGRCLDDAERFFGGRPARLAGATHTDHAPGRPRAAKEDRVRPEEVR